MEVRPGGAATSEFTLELTRHELVVLRKEAISFVTPAMLRQNWTQAADYMKRAGWLTRICEERFDKEGNLR